MAKVNAQQYVQKHSQRMKQSLEYIRDGINRVQQAPGEAAAQQQDRMLQGVTEAVNSGRWAERVRSVPLSEWKEKTANLGVNRISAGLDASASKNVAMAQKLLQAVDGAASEARSMPKGGIEDSIARVSTFIRRMHEHKGTIRS